MLPLFRAVVKANLWKSARLNGPPYVDYQQTIKGWPIYKKDRSLQKEEIHILKILHPQVLRTSQFKYNNCKNDLNDAKIKYLDENKI